MNKRFFVLWLVTFTSIITLEARPYGVGFDRNDNIQYDERWNQELESPEKHPIESFKRPYWSTKLPHHNAKLQRNKPPIRPLRQTDNGIEWNVLYLYNTDLDINLAFPRVNQGVIGGSGGSNESTVRFDTRGFAHDVKIRFPAFGYSVFGSMFVFHPESTIVGNPRASGYNLSFGNVISEYSGLSDSNFNFLMIGNERFLEKKKESRFSMLWGLSHLNLKRFERFRGLDRLGLSQATSSVLPNDPIIIEQGEYSLDKQGFGGFIGFGYHSHLGSGLSWGSKINYHSLSISQSTEVLIQRISSQSLIESDVNQINRDQLDGVLDFEFKFQKYLRHFYNLSIGFRYLQFLEEPRQGIDGISREKFALKGVQLSFQRFF